ncbi:MAG: glycine cleavage system protein GcvH [Peptococcia bacterium]|jgi:glycine cleavage system H protein
MNYQYPDNLKYTEDHEWILEKEGKGIVGITDYAQHSLGDIVFVELPELGQKVKIGDSLGVVESVKAVSEIYAPCSGTVRAVNENLLADPALLNDEPYAAGWIAEIEIEELSDKLLTAKEYKFLILEKAEEG